MRFHVSSHGWTIELGQQVIEMLTMHRQLAESATESVGQLYSRDLTQPVVCIDFATRLNPKMAWRGRVKFDRKKALAERETFFVDGWHCVGIWHTHPEPVPSPSLEDRMLARDYAMAARPQVDGIVFVIVGTKSFPDGVCAWIDDGQDLMAASAERIKS